MDTGQQFDFASAYGEGADADRPEGVSERVWQTVLAGGEFVGAQRDGDRLGICLALHEPALSGFAAGGLVLGPGEHDWQLMLTFIGHEPASAPQVCLFDLTARRSRRFWSLLAGQGELPLTYLSVDEGLVVARRTLSLAQALPRIEAALMAAELELVLAGELDAG